jgi:uncharacterized integral membrane protein
MSGERALATTDPTHDPQPGAKPEKRGDNARLLVAGAIAAILTAFALLNLDKVKVHWLVTTGRTPLIFVIVVAFLLGMAADRVLLLRGRRRRSKADETTKA